MNFGRWLTMMMQENQIRQIDLVRASGLHVNQIHGWKKGKKTPSSSGLMILATAISPLTNQPRPQILEAMCVAILLDS